MSLFQKAKARQEIGGLSECSAAIGALLILTEF
jgi:hypothetical protein